MRRIVGRYAARWWIEEYHKALKSGVGVEESQLGCGYRIESLVAVLAIVAVRLLNAKWLARTRGAEASVLVSLRDETQLAEERDANRAVLAAVFGREALTMLAARFGEPAGGWTHQRALVAVARLGGFLARKHDGLPGWQTIWRGWQRLMWMCDGLETLQQT